MMKNFFEAALFDELDPLYPDTNLETGKMLHTTSVASNTYAGVHIMLSGLTSGKCVTFEVIPPMKKTMLTKEDKTVVECCERELHYKLFELLPLPVEVNTGTISRTEWTDGNINQNVIRRAPFTVYDVLRPCTNVLTVQQSVMAFCFRCKVDSDKQELKKWDFIITHDGVSKHLTFEVEVFPVKILEAGATDHKYINWLSCKGISDYHHAPLFSDDWYNIFEKYLKLGKYGRQNMALLPVELYFEIKNGTSYLNEEKLDRLITILDKVGIYWIEGGHLAKRKNGEWMATQAELQITRKIIPGEGEQELENMCNQLYDYLQKHKLTNRWLQSFMDEPLDCLADTYIIGTQIVKKSMPEISVLEATIARESIAGTVNYWCPTVNKYEKYKEFFDNQHEKGDHILVYTCLDPAGNYCNRLLDQERLRQVWLGWAPALYDNIEGYLHWGGMFMDRLDFYRLSAPLPDITDYDTSRQNSLPAGDPAIMFPGFFEVYSSTRLESHRIGFEDLVLLEQLKERNFSWVENLIHTVFRRYDDYEKDVVQYRKARRLLLEKSCEELL